MVGLSPRGVPRRQVADEDFGRALVRSGEHLFAAVVLLKCRQYLGYSAALSEIPASIVNHVRVCL